MNLDFDVEKKVRDWYTTLRLAKKPNKDDYNTYLKLVLLGMGAVGAVGFIIQFISSLITFSGGR